MNRLIRRLLVTTDTLLRPMAAAAIIGLNKPIAAKGIATILYIKAKNKFCLMVEKVFLDNCIALNTLAGSDFIKTMLPASIAMSVTYVSVTLMD